MDPYEEEKSRTKRYRKLKSLLYETYGYEEFKPKQYEIINNIIQGNDVLAILPTGYGKSLTFQLPGLYIDKTTIVISPLISLMEDQKSILDKMGIESCCYNSNVTNKSLMRREITEGKYKFVYIAPEMMASQADFIQSLAEAEIIGLIAIDEAHCISTYGFDFRVSYRNLSTLKEMMPDVPILAVTATATDKVILDIITTLKIHECALIKSSFDRPNLFLSVNRKVSSLWANIGPIIKEHRDQTIIIYCITVKETEDVAKVLTSQGYPAMAYHAKLPMEERSEVHQSFLSGAVKYISATVAFGMGINKADVRVVIHYGLPANLESYYQEIGRAGRDGKQSWCYLFHNGKDFRIREFMINQMSNDMHKKNSTHLLKIMGQFATTLKCRRVALLNYFDEDYPHATCNNCDNCVEEEYDEEDDNVEVEEANLFAEAIMLFKLISSTRTSYGATTYINILRGSNNKKMTSELKKNECYGKGSHHSVAWWKDFIAFMIKNNYLQEYMLQGKCMIQVLKITKLGLKMLELEDTFDEVPNNPFSNMAIKS